MKTLHEKVKFFVYILESPSPEDLFSNVSEGKMLEKILSLHNVKSVLRTVANRDSFMKALTKDIYSQTTVHPDSMLIIHISAHGNDDGLGLTSGEMIEWNEIVKLLEAINLKMENTLLICLSACKSSSACTMALHGRKPFLGMIANKGKPTWPETATAYSCFYHLFSKGHNFTNAVKGMCMASDNDDFVFATINDIQYVETIIKNQNPKEDPTG